MTLLAFPMVHSLAFSLAMFALPGAIVALAFLLAALDRRRRQRRETPSGGSGE